jgi:hypothetical protein
MASRARDHLRRVMPCLRRRIDDRSMTQHYGVVVVGAVNPALTAMAGAIRAQEHLRGRTS